jgi:hypothetical protein
MNNLRITYKDGYRRTPSPYSFGRDRESMWRLRHLRLKFRNTAAVLIGCPDMGSAKGHSKGEASYGKGAEIRAVASSQLCCCACK